MKVLIAVSCLALMLSQVVHGFSPVSITGADSKTNTMRNPTELQVWNDPYAYGRNRYSPYVMPRRDNGMDSGYRRIGMNGESLYRGYGGRGDYYNGGYYGRYGRDMYGGGYGRGSYYGRDPYYNYGGYDYDRSRYDRDWYGGRGRDYYGSSRRYDYGYPEYGYGGYGGARMTNREVMDRFSGGGNYGYYGRGRGRGRGRGGRYYDDDYYY